MQPIESNSSRSDIDATDETPPLLWLQTGVFGLTFLIALIGVPWYAFSVGFHWSAWVACFAYCIATGMSITAGYHRLWSHNSYKAHPILRATLALLGAATVQNSIVAWASGHRAHHRHVDDTDQDPYSVNRGLWFSHMGWMLRDYPSGRVDTSNIPDVLRDPIARWQHDNYLTLVLIMNFGPALLMGWITGDWLANLLLIGVLRLVITHHTTFFINSLAHYWGRQPYSDDCSARDNGFIALFTYGEGYHNYHHRFQLDYRNGVSWWHWDPTKWLIYASSLIGLAHDLKRVPATTVAAARAEMLAKRPG